MRHPAPLACPPARYTPSSPFALAFSLGIAFLSTEGLAETTLKVAEGLSVTASVEAGAAVAATRGTNFGAGRFDVRSEEVTGDADWGEAFVKPILGSEYASQKAGTPYGGLSAVGTYTGGDGDAGGYTRNGDGNISLESAFVGWRSGSLLSRRLGEDWLDLSYGRQEFEVGDGFLLIDGNADLFGKGAYWLEPRKAFQETGLVRFDTRPAHGDLFYLRTDADMDETELAGLNVEVRNESFGSLGLLYFHVLDAAPPHHAGPREGMDVISLRAADLTLPFAPNFSLRGEYADQSGSGRDAEFDAHGWYLEGQYRFADWPWSPALSYRYARFSGDADPDDNRRRDFDPFFYGWSRGYGTWFQGEITGSYLLFNSNQVNHMLYLSASPSEALSLGLLYFQFDLDQPNYYGTPVSSKRFADEVNLTLDWTLNEQFSVTAAYGIAFPRTAAREAFGGDERYQLFELGLSMAF